MAVTLETSNRRYIGASTDTKPVLLADTAGDKPIPAGSSFLENDTGKIFRWDGVEWKHYEAPIDEQLQTLQMILVELTELRQLVALATS